MNKLNQNVSKGKASSEVFKVPSWVQNFATLSGRKARARLIILFLITVFLGLQIPKLQFNYDFNSFFPEGDEDLAYYEKLNEAFGEFNDFLFVVIKSDNPTAKSFLNQVKESIDSLQEFDRVKSVQSLFDLNRIQITPFGINKVSLLSDDLELPDGFDFDRLKGKFLGNDNKSILLIVRHIGFASKSDGDEFYQDLDRYIESVFDTDYLISGKAQMQYDFTRKFEKELASLLILALGFAVVVLGLIFKSLKGIIIPLVTLVISIVWTMGFLSLTGKSIDVMVVIIPAILLIVALSDVIHLVHKYDEFKRVGKNTKDSLYAVTVFIGKANCLTSITTCIGFLSLYVIPIQPIQDFGFFTAVGVFFAFVITFLLIPALLFYFPSPIEKQVSVNSLWQKWINSFFLFVLKCRKPILLFTVILSVILISGISMVRLNTSILVGFQKGEPELEQVAYFDSNFDGYKPFEIGISINEDRDLLDVEVLSEIEKLEHYLENDLSITHIESPLTLIKEINSGFYGGSKNYLKLPEAKNLRRLSRFYNSPRLSDSRRLFEIEGENVVRLIGRSKDIGSHETRKLNSALEDFLNSEIDSELINVRLTGTSYLIDKTDNYVVNSLIKGLAVATITVSILLLIFFREWRLVLISLVPNILPVLILFGLMGFFQIDLNISTAVIFTVAFGIAVDDSIHLIVRFYLEKDRSKSPIWAMKRTLSGTGKSIIVTSLVILAGFSLFISSGLSSPFYLGLFIAITAMVALILDLTVLPLLMLKISKKD
ncbi:efflux RND transporter permease subunit [Roseivirga misakiensis]|uniref:SSD domain-containing protein n=1 Tax=Roseivirga misakiensis TaxID=1563681 RepID=A0A1E5T1M3_9BACT|nr:efflux RND transporter permease subunit [Roseivirga misakiensis]OEK05261.1 hypothetical protein BFP71_17835 [Roseivirga misakiensis]